MTKARINYEVVFVLGGACFSANSYATDPSLFAPAVGIAFGARCILDYALFAYRVAPKAALEFKRLVGATA